VEIEASRKFHNVSEHADTGGDCQVLLPLARNEELGMEQPEFGHVIFADSDMMIKLATLTKAPVLDAN
jgi:hypothetical protein